MLLDLTKIRQRDVVYSKIDASEKHLLVDVPNFVSQFARKIVARVFSKFVRKLSISEKNVNSGNKYESKIIKIQSDGQNNNPIHRLSHSVELQSRSVTVCQSRSSDLIGV